MYYEVLVPRVLNGKGCIATYHSDTPRTIGAIVLVEFGKKNCPAIILEKVQKPSFKTKTIGPEITNPLPPPLLQLLYWMSEYYLLPLESLGQLVLPRGAEKKRRTSLKIKERKPKPHTLRPDQRDIVSKITKSDTNVAILANDTGFGKTHIYAELINQTLQNNKSAIVLLPEIELSGHLLQRLESLIDQQFAVLHYHSGLSESQRHSMWQHCLEAQKPVVVVGPRSALFMPLKDLGLIVIDEFHDQSYKQDTTPRYHATYAAAKLASLHGAKLLLASATPSIEDSFMAESRNIPVFTNTIDANHTLTTTKIDTSDREQFKHHAFLSDAALSALEQAVSRSATALVLLNRRGTATAEICDDCGWALLCPDCESPMIYHHGSRIMRCHICGKSTQPMHSCPECRSIEVRFKGIGTEKLSRDLAQKFGDATVVRIDGDQKASDLSQSNKGKIIVGTQLIAKGIDLEHADTLVIVSADTALSFPDFRANEQTFQLLYQAIGRIGRRGQDRTLIIQSRYPNHSSIEHAIARNYQQFYAAELKDRKQHQYPPYTHMAKIVVARASNQRAESVAHELVSSLTGTPQLRIKGPIPAFQHKHSGKYRWNILLYAKNRSTLLSALEKHASKEYIDIDPLDAL